jgi:hypothetical protein
MKFCSICNGRLFLSRGVAVVVVDMPKGSAFTHLSYEVECDTCGHERNIVMPRVPLFVADDESRTLVALNARLTSSASEQLADLFAEVEAELGVHPSALSGEVAYAKKYEVVEKWLDEKITRLNKSLLNDSFDTYSIKRRVIGTEVGKAFHWNSRIMRHEIEEQLSASFVNATFSKLLSLSHGSVVKASNEYSQSGEEKLWNSLYDDGIDDEEDFETEDHGYFDDIPY